MRYKISNKKSESNILKINKGKKPCKHPLKAKYMPVFKDLDSNLNYLKSLLGDDRFFTSGVFEVFDGKLKIGMSYFKNMVNVETINKNIISPLLNFSAVDSKNLKFAKNNLQDFITQNVISIVHSGETAKMSTVVEELLDGNLAIFADGMENVILINTRDIAKRAIEKSETEVSIRGSKESFTEDIETNCALIRKRLATPDLRFKQLRLGRISRTRINIVWIEGIANPKIIKEALIRLKRIDIDYISGHGMINELIEDKPLSIWPQTKMSERPDVLASHLADGCFGIICDGMPFVIIAPVNLWQALDSVDDYIERPMIGLFAKIIRYLSLLISIFLSPVYLAFVAYNHTILPPDLALHIASGREYVPFPSIMEILIMTLTIDTLREAGTRLSKALGSTIGILGAVVIGQAAVAAGYVSASLIIIIAATAISTFTIPSYPLINAARICNYFLIICAGIFGLVGVVLGTVFLLWTSIGIRSFGIPLLYPLSPFDGIDSLKTILRSPVRMLWKRPELLSRLNKHRMGENTIWPSRKASGPKR